MLCSLTRQHVPETVPVRKVNGLPRASFSRNLAIQTLPLAMCLAPPPALRDFHPVEFAHAERTYERPTTSLRSPAFKLIAEGTTGKISALIEAENLLLRSLENEAVLFPSTSELKAGTVQRLILYPLK